MSDVEHAIEGLPWFEQRCPLQIPLLAYFGTLQIVFLKKKKETRKCYFSSCKIFLKQYFGLNFRRLEEKQEPKSREYGVCKRLNFPRFPGTSLNKAIGGRFCRSTHLIESPCSWCAWMQSDVKTKKAFSIKIPKLPTTPTPFQAAPLSDYNKKSIPASSCREHWLPVQCQSYQAPD